MEASAAAAAVAGSRAMPAATRRSSLVHSRESTRASCSSPARSLTRFSPASLARRNALSWSSIARSLSALCRALRRIRDTSDLRSPMAPTAAPSPPPTARRVIAEGFEPPRGGETTRALPRIVDDRRSSPTRSSPPRRRRRRRRSFPRIGSYPRRRSGRRRLPDRRAIGAIGAIGSAGRTRSNSS